jgi:hypothetical protein
MGASICAHGRHRSGRKECAGASICAHSKERSKCKECGGASICAHGPPGRRRSRCKECGGASKKQGQTKPASPVQLESHYLGPPSIQLEHFSFSGLLSGCPKHRTLVSKEHSMPDQRKQFNFKHSSGTY